MTVMTMIHKISIAKDFSAVPAGRFYTDGEDSGQAFRERLLVPALTLKHDLLIDLDGTEGYGSSFLEEAFGGLIRRHRFDSSELMRCLSFKSEEDPTLIEEIHGYLKDEAGKFKKQF